MGRGGVEEEEGKALRRGGDERGEGVRLFSV
jgi:hypothetical protein